jgi:hypothetical protein
MPRISDLSETKAKGSNSEKAQGPKRLSLWIKQWGLNKDQIILALLSAFPGWESSILTKILAFPFVPP